MINELILEKNGIGPTETILRLPSQEIADESSLDNVQDAYTVLKDMKMKNH